MGNPDKTYHLILYCKCLRGNIGGIYHYSLHLEEEVNPDLYQGAGATTVGLVVVMAW